MDIVECQGARERRRLAAAAHVVCVCMCVAGLCGGVFMQRRQIEPVSYTGL